MDNNVCPICGTELMTSVWDYERDVVMFKKYPAYRELIRVSAQCRKCKKGRYTVFHKKDEMPVDEMKRIACQLFCEEWGKNNEVKDAQDI